jgi:hypothetical protein
MKQIVVVALIGLIGPVARSDMPPPIAKDLPERAIAASAALDHRVQGAISGGLERGSIAGGARPRIVHLSRRVGLGQGKPERPGHRSTILAQVISWSTGS